MLALGPKQLTMTNWPQIKWCRLAKKGDHENILLSPEPSCPRNLHFVMKPLARSQFVAVSWVGLASLVYYCILN